MKEKKVCKNAGVCRPFSYRYIEHKRPSTMCMRSHTLTTLTNTPGIINHQDKAYPLSQSAQKVQTLPRSTRSGDDIEHNWDLLKPQTLYT
ncbi:hypothetical protein TNCT_191131 [Trichonephila clavata]|uniref:Uncharacterized protein n=1 Tax=Trichonephila clavata TaxID=2740835 RepID=A0A8X6J0B3_TRICU|nr:hypothetical protein TNCT_191131 [Trichonephila clavata]